MAKVAVVLGPVEHDGKLYGVGDEMELPKAAEVVLVAAGVVEEAKVYAARVKAAAESKAAAEKAEADLAAAAAAAAAQ